MPPPYNSNRRRAEQWPRAGRRGAARGENIYVHKCWVCHNQYQGPAPRLTEFSQGGGTDEQGLTIQIRDA